MALSATEYQKRLDRVFSYQGVAYGRLALLSEEENSHLLAASKFTGYAALSDAFKCFYLETVERCNTEIRETLAEKTSEFYPQFVSRLSHVFRALCGAEKIALLGYPYQGYTLLRNEFDNLVLVGAAMQGITDFYLISGIQPGQAYEENTAKKLRKNNEYEVRRLMLGTKSGLSQPTIDDLKKLDEMFVFQTHGSHLSLASALDFIGGTAPLPVVPRFEERASALFMNRYCEVAWMAHRLIPLFQPSSASFDGEWRDKWTTVDESFNYMVDSLTRENGLAIGRAYVEFIDAKFPFNSLSKFPQ